MYYKHRQQAWHRSATVRYKPRVIISDLANKTFYPITRQPLCVHPIVVDKGSKTINFILLQSMYYFMASIAEIETELVNASALDIAYNRLGLVFPKDMVLDMFSIVIDEAYHAHVAIDFIQQVENITNVPRVLFVMETDLSYAVKKHTKALPAKLHRIFQLICVCISENTLTKELVGIINEQSINHSFKQVMQEHLLDEGRHAGIFADVLAILWKQLSISDSKALMLAALDFLQTYLNMPIKLQYDSNILLEAGFSKDVIDKIISDVKIEQTLNKLKRTNPIVGMVIKLFSRAEILQREEVASIIKEKGIG